MYGLISDTHCHNWSAFSHTDSDGVNSRLRIILNEIERAAIKTRGMGGEYLVHAGDLFHIRGSVAPSVLNPTLETFSRIVKMGITPVIISGNHDNEFKHTSDIGSSISALQGIGCIVVNKPTLFNVDSGPALLLVPWMADKKEFMDVIDGYSDCSTPLDLICHAPLDGVFSEMPHSECIDWHEIQKRAPCIKRIFAGHLHAHKKLDEGVYSIGAIAQHNWGDVNRKVGFMAISDEIEFFASHAPKFVEVKGSESKEELMLEVDGNYVRATVEMNESEINEFRQFLEDSNAKGVTIICHVPAKERADRLEISGVENMSSVLSKYIDKSIDVSIRDKVKAEALKIMGM